MNFSELGLSELIVKAVLEKGYSEPSPIQLQAIPLVLEGHDLMAAAQTGTGKTAGFVLPILQQLSQRSDRVKSNHLRVLILTPTRELAAQVGDSVAQYAKYVGVSSDVIFGGVKINPQMMRLRKGVDVLVATPGRLLDLHNQNAIKFDQVDILVLDEADRMLDMGFIHDIKRIVKLIPSTRQTLLFSATFSPEIRQLAQNFLRNPQQVSVSQQNSTAVTVEQSVYNVDKNQKCNLLIQLIKKGKWEQVLVFTRTKHGANKLSDQLNKNGIQAAAIHGNKSQGARTQALANFKSNDVRVLVATDIAARGIDIAQLPYVVNYELPHVAEDYVHRIGRTGRAGATGIALSLVCEDEFKQLVAIERLTQKAIERKSLAGFEPSKALPTNTDLRPPKPPRPKKPKPERAEAFGDNLKQDTKPDSRGGSSVAERKPNAPKPQGAGRQPNQTKPAVKPQKPQGQKPAHTQADGAEKPKPQRRDDRPRSKPKAQP